MRQINTAFLLVFLWPLYQPLQTSLYVIELIKSAIPSVLYQNFRFEYVASPSIYAKICFCCGTPDSRPMPSFPLHLFLIFQVIALPKFLLYYIAAQLDVNRVAGNNYLGYVWLKRQPVCDGSRQCSGVGLLINFYCYYDGTLKIIYKYSLDLVFVCNFVRAKRMGMQPARILSSNSTKSRA